MTGTHVSLPAIENAIRDVYSALDKENYKPPTWSRMNEDDLWRELVACVLGSRVRFEAAHAAIERMDEMGLLTERRRSRRFDQYEKDTVVALSGGYPFYRVRAKQIRRAAEHLYGNRRSVREYLDDAQDTREARRRMASEVPGLGPKQASLFLRNIGYATHIAVLDVHVLTYMCWVGLTEEIVKSISTVLKYEKLENLFIEHSYSFGYTPDHFDLAVWVVVKVAKEEYKSWG